MSDQQLPTRIITGVTVPATPIIDKANELAKKFMEPIGYRHVVRSWLIGALMIARLPQSMRNAIDIEAFSVATLLHDLGWSAELTTKDKIFEVDGANAARDFLLREGPKAEWDKHRIQLVWDSIALHTHPVVAAHKEPEVALTNGGIMTELWGVEFAKQRGVPGVEQISPEEIEKIYEEFPKKGFKEYMKGVLCSFCRNKPDVTYLTFVSKFGDRYVEGYSSEGKQVVDLVDGLMED